MRDHASPPLPPGWAATTLGDVLPLSYGKGLIEKVRDATGGVPVFGSSGRVGIHSEALTNGPTLIVGRKGSVGEVHYSPAPCWPIDTTYFSTGSESTDLPFFGFLLRFAGLRQLDKSTAIPGLSRDDYNRVEVGIPPLAEQKRIVAEIEKQFTRLDAGVAALERVGANLKRYREAVLKAAVEGRLVPTEAELARAEGRGYETGAELLTVIRGDVPDHVRGGRLRSRRGEPTSSSESRSLPDGWAWTTCAELLREPLRNGHSAKASTSGTGVKTLTLTAVTRADFSDVNTKLTVADPAKVRDLWIECGDIFVERSNTPELVGTASLYRGEADFAIFPDLLIRVRLSRIVSAAYVEAVFRSDVIRRYFRANAQGISGTMPKIDQGVIENAPIPLPPLAEQYRIVSEIERRYSLIDELEATVNASIKRAGRLRQAILKRAFEGRLVPQDPNDEPASVLLDRIRSERAAGATPARRMRQSRGAPVGTRAPVGVQAGLFDLSK